MQNAETELEQAIADTQQRLQTAMERWRHLRQARHHLLISPALISPAPASVAGDLLAPAEAPSTEHVRQSVDCPDFLVNALSQCAATAPEQLPHCLAAKRRSISSRAADGPDNSLVPLHRHR